MCSNSVSLLVVPFGQIAPHPEIPASLLSLVADFPRRDNLFSEAGKQDMATTVHLPVIRTGKRYLLIGEFQRWRSLISLGFSPSALVTVLIHPRLSAEAVMENYLLVDILWPVLLEPRSPSFAARMKYLLDHFEEAYGLDKPSLKALRSDGQPLSKSFIEQKVLGLKSGALNRNHAKSDAGGPRG